MKQAVVIINPHSGRRKKRIDLVSIKKIFLKNNYEVRIFFTCHKGHAKEIVQQLSFVDLVVSVGGDGTFNEIMTGNFNRNQPLLLSHIPTGTANDIGAMYGYGNNLVNNIKKLLKGKVKNIDVCTINNQPFTYVAAFGKFTNVSYETPRWLKKRFGYFAYLLGGLKELKGKTNLYSLKYEINGKVQEGKYSFILISNANRIAGINNFYHDIKLDDDQFEVLFCSMKEYHQVAKSLIHLAKKDISDIPGFEFYKTNHLKISFEKEIDKGFSIDGEEFQDKNKNFDIQLIRNVKIMVPCKNINKLFLDKE